MGRWKPLKEGLRGLARYKFLQDLVQNPCPLYI